jgi:hypothetical protein
MKVGDLVKIYNFTHKARKYFSNLRQIALTDSDVTNVDAHIVGLIVKGDGSPKYGHYREVLRCCDGQTDFYNVARLEVINGNR